MKGNEPQNPMPFLRDRLHGMESDAPGLGWDSFQQHRKKRRLIVWRYAGFSLLALLTIAALVTGYRKSADKQLPYTRKQAATPSRNQAPQYNPIPSDQAPALGIAGIEPHKPKRLPSPQWPPIFTDAERVSTEQQMPNDTNTLPDLSSRPVSLLLESASQPQSLLRTIEFERNRIHQVDSWKWHWGISVGTGLFRPVTQATTSGQAFIHHDYAAIRRKFEVGIFSQSLRLQTAAFKGNWMFSAGIGIHRQATQANYDFIYSEAPVIDRDGRIIAYAATNPQRIAFNSTHYLTSTELPVSLAWRWKKARDYSLYLRFGATPSFLGAIKGTLPDPVLLDRREKFSPVNYRIDSQSFSLALPLLLQTGTRSGLELSPEWKWHSGLRQAQGHYLSRYNQSGITCSYYVRF